MPSLSLRNSPPENEQDFESLCLRLFSKRWDTSDLKKFGRRGQKQYGVDLVGTDGKGKICAIQCKHRESHRPLTESDFKAEVELAKSFKLPIERYAIATSAKRAKEIQTLAIETTRQHKEAGLFTIEIVFWDDLNEWLNEDPDVWNTVYGTNTEAPTFTASSTAAQIVESTGPRESDTSEPENIHSDIDEAGNYLTNGNPQLAIILLNRLTKRYRHQFTPRCEYRVHANLGHAHMVLNELTDTVKEYQLAFQAQPEDPDARRFYAHSYLLRGNAIQCHKFINELMTDYPNDSKARTIWIHSLPKELDYSAAIDDIPKEQLDDNEVAYALSILAARSGLWEDAEKHARVAANISPSWPNADANLAEVLLERSQVDSTIDRSQFAREAIDYIHKAIEQWKGYAGESVISPLWCNLSVAYVQLNDLDNTKKYLSKAADYASTNSTIAMVCARIYHMIGETDKAIEILKIIVPERSTFRNNLMLSQMLVMRNRSTDHTEARSILRNLSDSVDSQDDELISEWIETLIKLNLSLENIPEATSTLDHERSKALETCRRNILEAQIAIADNRQGDASSLASQAIQSTSADTEHETIRSLARLLERLDNYKEAIKCWQKIINPHHADGDLRQLIHCAERCKRWDLIAETCKVLRESGTIEHDFIYAEIGELERLSPTRTLDLLSTLLENSNIESQQKCELLVHKQLLEIQLHKTTETTVTLDDVLAVDELPHCQLGRATVEALRNGPNPKDALDYAYNLFRRFPDDLESWSAVTASVNLDIPHKAFGFEKITSVRPGVAVQYKDDITGEYSWWIIEDAPDPKISRNERDPTDPIASAMLNKKVDDSFDLRFNPLPSRTATITAIQSKLEYRWRYCLDQIEDRFSSSSPVFKFTVPHKEDGDIDIEAFIEQLKGMQTGEEESLDLYRTNAGASIHMVGKGFSKTPFEMVQILSQDKSTSIRCTSGELNIRNDALSILNNAKRMVIEETAAGTLYYLAQHNAINVPELLKSIPYEIVISEFTLSSIRHAIECRWGKDGDRKFMGVRDGKLHIEEYSPEHVQAIYDKFNRFLESLESNCQIEVRSSIVIPDEKKRNLYSDVFGDGGLHAIELASQADHALWTDDYVCAGIAINEHSCRRVWSQIILMWLADRGLLATDQEAQSGAWLMAAGYDYTSFGSRHAIAAGDSSSWDTTKEPVLSVLRGFGNPNSNFDDVVRISAETLRLVWQKQILEESKQAFSYQMFDSIDSRPAGRRVIRIISNNVQILFGLDVVTAQRFQQVIDSWLATQRKIEMPGG